MWLTTNSCCRYPFQTKVITTETTPYNRSGVCLYMWTELRRKWCTWRCKRMDCKKWRQYNSDKILLTNWKQIPLISPQRHFMDKLKLGENIHTMPELSHNKKGHRTWKGYICVCRRGCGGCGGWGERRGSPSNKRRSSNSGKFSLTNWKQIEYHPLLFTQQHLWKSYNPTIWSDWRYIKRNTNNTKTLVETNNNESVSHPIFKVCINRHRFNNCRWNLTR